LSGYHSADVLESTTVQLDTFGAQAYINGTA